MSFTNESHQMEDVLNKLEKDIKFKQYKSKNDDFISSLIGSGLPWYVILIVLFICLLVMVLVGSY
jgi:hypothetical protein